MDTNYHGDRTGHPYDLIGSRYLLGEQELPLASERKQNSKANVEEDKPPGRDQSTVGFTGRPLFSNASEDRPMTSERDNSEETSQCLSLLQKRLSAKKHQVQEKEVEIESHQKEVDTMERMCNDYKTKIAALEATSPYRLPPYERQLVSDYTKKSEEIQCEIAKRVQVVNRLLVSSREIEEHCESLGEVIEGIEKELGSHKERGSMLSQGSEEGGHTEKLEYCKWYWGDLTKKMSRNIILYSPLGSFLVRNSSSTPGEYVLAFKVRDMTMMKIKHVGDKYGLSVGCLKFSSVPELVAYYRAHSLAEVDPVIDLMLSTPIEKYTLQDSSDDSSDDDDFNDGSDGDITSDVVSDQEHKRISALTNSGKWNYCDPDKHYVTPVRIVNYIHHLSPKWELLGYKLAVETTVKNLRESPISNSSKCIQVLEAWLESTNDVSWQTFLTILIEMNMMRAVNDIIEQEKLNICVWKTPKGTRRVK